MAVQVDTRNDKVSHSSSSINRRLRDIFSPKSKPTTSAPTIITTVSPPSRIPIRKKRSFTDVTGDVQDKGSAINPRAKVRQRLDSTSSIATLRGLPRKSSTDSIRTIAASESNPPPVLKRTASKATLALNPGPSAPAKAILTRSTSHNQADPTSVRAKRNILPFPTRKLSALKSSHKPSVAENRDVTDIASGANPSIRKPKSLFRLRTNSSTSNPNVSMANLPTSPAPSITTAGETPLPKEPATLSPEDEMLRQVLQYVVHEIDDDDDHVDEAQFRALLEESNPSVPPSRTSSLFSTFAETENADYDEIPGLGLDEAIFNHPDRMARPSTDMKSLLERFDIKVQPLSKHTAMWDLHPTDIYAWPAILCISDKDFKHTGFEQNPPVRHIDIEFHSVEETSSDHDPSSEYFVKYVGHTIHAPLSPSQLPTLNPAHGICVESRWIWGPFPSEKLGIRPPADTTYLIKFYVPIPASLFEGRECRKFKVKSKVEFGGWDFPMNVSTYAGTEAVTIEHLRKEVHMDGRRPLGAR